MIQSVAHTSIAPLSFHPVVVRTGLFGETQGEVPLEMLRIIFSMLKEKDLGALSLVNKSWFVVVHEKVRLEFCRFAEYISTIDGKLDANEKLNVSAHIRTRKVLMLKMGKPSQENGASIYKTCHVAMKLVASLALPVVKMAHDACAKFAVPENDPSASSFEIQLVKTWNSCLKDSPSPLSSQHMPLVLKAIGMFARGDKESFRVAIQNLPWSPSLLAHKIVFRSLVVSRTAYSELFEELIRRPVAKSPGNYSLDVSFVRLLVGDMLSGESMDGALVALEKLPFVRREDPEAAKRESFFRVTLVGIQEAIEVAAGIQDTQKKLDAFKCVVRAILSDGFDDALDALKKVSGALSAHGMQSEGKKVADLMAGEKIQKSELKKWSSDDQESDLFFPLMPQELDTVMDCITVCIFRMGIEKATVIAASLENIQKRSAAFQALAMYMLAKGDADGASQMAKKIPQPGRQKAVLDHISSKSGKPHANSLPVAVTKNSRRRRGLFSELSSAQSLEGLCLSMTMQEATKELMKGGELSSCNNEDIIAHIVRHGGLKMALGLVEKKDQSTSSSIIEQAVVASICVGRLDEAIQAAKERGWPEEMVVPLCRALYARRRIDEARAMITALFQSNSKRLWEKEFFGTLLLLGESDVLIGLMSQLHESVVKEGGLQHMVSFMLESGNLSGAVRVKEALSVALQHSASSVLADEESLQLNAQ